MTEVSATAVTQLRRRGIPLYAKVIAGVAVGVLLGLSLGKEPTAPLGDIGLLVIRLLKALAAPLIFFCVVDALLRTKIAARKGAILVCISIVNACVATGIGFAVSSVWQPDKGSLVSMAPSPDSSSTPNEEKEKPTLDPLKNVAGYVPENLVEPFRKNSVISIVLIALLVGAALRSVKNRGDEAAKSGIAVVESATGAFVAAFSKLLAWIVQFVPFAVLGVVAAVVGKSGVDVFQKLGLFLLTVIVGLALQAIGYYSLLLVVVAHRSPLKFFAGALDSITTALSCGSSLATLPITLRCLSENLRVSTSSARLAAIVGTNLNHDGIILYEAAAAIFVARGFGYDVGPAQAVTIALSSVMAGIGIAGVPEAGLITLPLVLSAAGLPNEVVAVAVPLILPVDWIIGRCRAATNVISDMTVATMLDRLAPDDATPTTRLSQPVS